MRDSIGATFEKIPKMLNKNFQNKDFPHKKKHLLKK